MDAEGHSDLASAELCVREATALDTACFHAQRAAEKYLKAFLIAREIDFPFIHNLEKLVELRIDRDPTFRALDDAAERLTPYAVALRYDAEFWPSVETAREAVADARTIVTFVRKKL